MRSRPSRPGVVRGDDRAVSTTVGYVIALVITAVLISGLLTAGGAFLDGQRDQVAREEMTVIGERTAAGVVDADRLASTSDGQGTVYLRVSLPRQVAGATYAVGVNNTTAPGAAASQPYAYDLVLRSDSIGIRETVPVRLHHELRVQAVTGGDVVVAFVDTDGDGQGELELRKAIDVPSPAEPVLLSHIEAAYVTPDGELSTVTNDSAPLRYDTAGTVGIIGPKWADLDGDGLREVLYVNGTNALRSVDVNNESTLLATNARATNAKVIVHNLADGPWAYYVEASTESVYRVRPGESPREAYRIPAGSGYGISTPVSFADIDGDSADEFAYVDNSGQLRYVDHDVEGTEVGSSNQTKITGGAVGSSASYGVGQPYDFDGDGEERIPYVGTSSEAIYLIDAQGNDQKLFTDPGNRVDPSPLSTIDVDSDGEREIIYLSGGTAYYVDDVTGSPTREQLRTASGAAVEGDTDMGIV